MSLPKNPEIVNSFTPSSSSTEGLTVQQMASHIASLRQPVSYPHITPNPLIGNTLY